MYDISKHSLEQLIEALDAGYATSWPGSTVVPALQMAWETDGRFKQYKADSALL